MESNFRISSVRSIQTISLHRALWRSMIGIPGVTFDGASKISWPTAHFEVHSRLVVTHAKNSVRAVLVVRSLEVREILI